MIYINIGKENQHGRLRSIYTRIDEEMRAIEMKRILIETVILVGKHDEHNKTFNTSIVEFDEDVVVFAKDMK